MTTVMGCDAKLIQRGSLKVFKANIGVATKTDNVKKFNKFYDDYMEEVFKTALEAKMEKGVYKSSELRKYFEEDEKSWLRFLTKFAEDFSKLDYCDINVIISLFNFSKMKEVNTGGTDRFATIKEPPDKFIDTLNGYFSYLVPWKVCKTCKLFNWDILVDDFSGYETNAWNELRAHNKLQGIPNGDRCNRLISTSDIIIRFVDSMLASRGDRLSMESIEQLVMDFKLKNYHSFIIGRRDLKDIVPINKKNVFLSQVYKKPTIFVLKENVIPRETEFIYNNEVMMAKLCNFATVSDTGFKVMDYAYDNKLINHGDILVYYGDNGKAQAELLKKMGLKVLTKDIQKI